MTILARATIVACLLPASAGLAFAQDACAPTPPVVTPDGATSSVFFDNLLVTAGSGGTSSDRSSCRVRIPVQLPTGDSIGIYKIDYRGGVQLTAGQVARLTATPANGRALVQTFRGPDGQDYLLSQLAGSQPNGEIDLALLLELQAGQLGDALGVLDSADITTVDYTSLASVTASIDQLATERAAMLAHLAGSADLLLGFTDPIEEADNAGLLAAGGSALAGAKAHTHLSDGFSVLAGAAYFQQSAAGAEASGFPLLAGGVRYVRPGTNSLRPFAEGGIWGAPDIDMRFSRQYANSKGTVDSSGDASGSVVGIYGRLGVIYVPDPLDEIALSGTLSQSWLHVGAYAEPGGAGNLFPATIDSSTLSSQAVKATAAWTRTVSDRVDFTLSAAAGRTFGGARDVVAGVDWIGPVTGTVGNFTFVEYGARVGVAVTENVSADAFVFGTTGETIDNHTQYGGALKIKF